MPWWSWLIIWTVLVLGSLGMLAGLGLRLFRKALRTLQGVEAVGEQISAIDINLAPPSAPFQPAIFADAQVLRQGIAQRSAERTHRSQQRRDALIVRGKLIRHTR